MAAGHLAHSVLCGKLSQKWPVLAAALAKLKAAADPLRGELSGNEAALAAVEGAEQLTRRERDLAAPRQYTLGRIDALLGDRRHVARLPPK
jgi:hypothetical protein